MKAATAIFLLAFMGVLAIASCDPEPRLLIDESLKVDANAKPQPGQEGIAIPHPDSLLTPCPMTPTNILPLKKRIA